MQSKLSPGGNNQSNKHTIELFLRGNKFKTKDTTQEPTTCLEVSLNGAQQGITELITSSRPRYDRTITIDYVFERTQTIQIKCFDRNSVLQGQCSFPLGALVGSKNNSLKIPLEVTNNGLTSGLIRVMYEGITSEELKQNKSSSEEITRAAFSEYLNGGLNISVVVCVDFTVSNGYPNNKHSLHYISNEKLNDYQMAITSVCGILMNYDNDRKIPMYGFGCKPKFKNFDTNGKVSHFFPCSGDWGNCAGSGIQELFDIYSNCLSNVELSGPTYFEPLLEEVCKFAEAGFKKNPRNYTTLLILTDGVIHDMEETIELVVQAANLPISIIIVGIGKENFEDMKILDDDNGKLMDEDGNKPSRDIIQFVEFNQYKNKELGALAEEVLKEMPNQVCSFMQSRNIQPEVNINDHQSVSNEDEDMYYPQQDEKFMDEIRKNKMVVQSDNNFGNYGNNSHQDDYANYYSAGRRTPTNVNDNQFNISDYKQKQSNFRRPSAGGGTTNYQGGGGGMPNYQGGGGIGNYQGGGQGGQ